MNLASVNKILRGRLKSRHNAAVPNKLQRLGDVLDTLRLDLDLLDELVRALALAQNLYKRHKHAVVGNVGNNVGQGRDEALAELLVHPARENLAATRRERRRGVSAPTDRKPRKPCAGVAGSQTTTTGRPWCALRYSRCGLTKAVAENLLQHDSPLLA